MVRICGREIVATGKPTYSSGTQASELCYFVVHRDLAVGAKCHKLDSATIPKHQPVMLVLAGACRHALVPRLVRPLRLPHGPDSDNKIGCKPPPPSLHGFEDRAKQAVRNENLETLYQEWCQEAIGEVIETLDVQDKFRLQDYTKPLRFKKVQAMLQCQGVIVADIRGTTWRHVAGEVHEYLKYTMLGQHW